MKISIIISVLILAIGGYFVWDQKETIRVEREEVTLLESKAEELDLKEVEDGKFRRVADREVKRDEVEVDDVLQGFVDLMKEIGRNGEPNQEQMGRVIELLDRLTAMSTADMKDMLTKLKATTELKEEEREGLTSMIVAMMANQNPEAALRLATESPELFIQDGNIDVDDLLPMVAAKDPALAMEWIRQHPETELDRWDMARIASAAARSGGAELGFTYLKEFLEKTKTDESREELLQSGVRQIFATIKETGQINNVLKQGQELGLNETQMDSMYERIGESPVMQDFTKASEWLSENKPGDRALVNLFEGISEQNENRTEWLGWIETNLEGEIAKATTSTMISRWSRANYQEAGEWIGNLVAGDMKNHAVYSYATTLAPYEPAAAAEWADTLPAGEDRTNALQTIYESWKTSDTAAAEAFARQHGLREAGE